MKFLPVFVLTFTFSTASDDFCLVKCNQECDQVRALLSIILPQASSQGFCGPKCEKVCECQSSCQAECDRHYKECSSSLPPFATIICEWKTTIRRSVYCPVLCAVASLQTNKESTFPATKNASTLNIQSTQSSTTTPQTATQNTTRATSTSATSPKFLSATTVVLSQQTSTQSTQTSSTQLPFLLDLFQSAPTVATSQQTSTKKSLLLGLLG